MKKIGLLGTPVEVGTGRMGCRMGPDGFRCAFLDRELEKLGHEVVDFGDLRRPEEKLLNLDINAKFPGEITAWMELIADKGYQVMRDGYLPIFLGGDHSMAMGTIAASHRHAKEHGKEFFVLWIDAHTDYNIPATSPTGNMHGMPVAALCGEKDLSFIYDDIEGFEQLNPKNIYQLGIRSVDDQERELVSNKGINIFDMRKIDEKRIVTLITEIIQKVKKKKGVLHVSFDVDGLDPSIAPGVGTRVPGGINYREAHLIMEMLYDADILYSLDLTELNPFIDDRGKTAKIMADLIGSLFGKKIIKTNL